MVEHVAGVDGGLPLLLVSEHQVDPVVQAVRHVVGLQRRAVHADELARVAARPRREHHVAQCYPGLFEPWNNRLCVHGDWCYLKNTITQQIVIDLKSLLIILRSYIYR